MISRIIRICGIMTPRMRIIRGITTPRIHIIHGIMTSCILHIRRVSYFSEYLREIKKELKTVLACPSGTQIE